MEKRPPDRVLLVSRHFESIPFNGLPLIQIALLADKERCKTIVYALSTVDVRGRKHLTHKEVFGPSKFVQRIFLESGNLDTEDDLKSEVWLRGQSKPKIFYRRFAVSSAPAREKQAFVDEIAGRMVGNIFWMICGELNSIQRDRKTGKFRDQFEVLAKVQRHKPNLVLNSWHTYCRRYEIRKKQAEFSRGRIVLSVWNERGAREPARPFSVFRNGEQVTSELREIERPLPTRTDVRAGVFNLNQF